MRYIYSWAAFTINKGQRSLSVKEFVTADRRKLVQIQGPTPTRPSPSFSFATFASAIDVEGVVVNGLPGPSDIYNSNGIVTPIANNDILTTQDIVIGAILACVLALGYSYLNGQSSSSSFTSWPTQSNNNANDDLRVVHATMSEQGKTFNSDDWREMSRKENYILYNTKIRRSNKPIKGIINAKRENKSTLVALLLLFVPIFSADFFFALSRQFMCEMENDVASRLCSPVS